MRSATVAVAFVFLLGACVAQAQENPLQVRAAPPATRPTPEMRYLQSIKQAERDFWDARMRAQEIYIGELKEQLTAAMRAGDLDLANRINATKQSIEAELAGMTAGDQITIQAPLPRVVACAGFNIKKGMGIHPNGPSPYREGQTIARLEDADFGWSNAWTVSDGGGSGGAELARIDRAASSEGDGCVAITIGPARQTWIHRTLKNPLTGKLQIEQRVMAPGGLSMFSRPGGGENGASCWGVRRGEFYVLDGTGGGSMDERLMKTTGIKFNPKTWYTIVVTLDMATSTWEFAVDGKKFDAGKALGFRGSPKIMGSVDYLFDSPAYLDAIKVVHLAR